MMLKEAKRAQPMTFKDLFNRKQKKLNVLLRVAIFQRDISDVEKLLREGADPNAFADSVDRYRPLGNAIRQNAPIQIFDALLKAGADPQEPYRLLGWEFLLSEAAQRSGLPKEVVHRLQLAENEAEIKNGPRKLFRGYKKKSCPPPKYGT
jgi:hypothetical protein